MPMVYSTAVTHSATSRPDMRVTLARLSCRKASGSGNICGGMQRPALFNRATGAPN
jgi:hypothetical protein